ncbi:HK97 gp10 family phage protein [Roseomonas chloroacetimidivorans]|uniref:HK97 gp10 family phage protein n=1 Tax=Roseomonas chloroacetimidivorans TaxID=1766656 RepID=UPI003C75FD15
MIRLQVSAPSYQFVYSKKNLRKTLRQAGNEVAKAARALIRSSAGTGRTYYGTGGSSQYRGGYKSMRYQASAPGEAPVNVTGTLARSIKVRPFKSGEGVAVRDTAFYALFLQAGASGGGRMVRGGKRVRGKAGAATGRDLQPRQFLTKALDQVESGLRGRIEASLRDDVAMVRVKR